MSTPVLHVHLIDDPTQPPTLEGDRGTVVHEVCREARQAILLERGRRAVLVAAAEDLRERLQAVITTVPGAARSSEWDVLDVLVFQSAHDNPDAHRCRGVMGFYNDGISHPFTISPFVELYALAGHETRLPAAAVHEVGHFLRARAVWEIGEKPFIHRAFEEGLCEHLVERELGGEQVLHDSPLSRPELVDLHRQLLASLNAIRNSQEHATFTQEGYRLGYHVVRDLLADGHELAALFRLPLPETEEVMLNGCQLLSNRLSPA